MGNKSQRNGREKYFDVARRNWGQERRIDEQRGEVIVKNEMTIKKK
jgi:hypothetical protein